MSFLGFWLVLSHAMPGASTGDRASSRGDLGLGIVLSAPTECGDADTLRARLDALGVDDAAQGRLRVDVTETPDGWAATLVLETADGAVQRTARAPTCPPLLDAAAVITAIALDPIAVAHQVRVTPSIPEPTATPPAPLPASADAIVTTRGTADASPGRAKLRARPWIGAHAIVGRGLLPRLDVGAEVTFALALARRAITRARVELAGWVLAPQSASFGDRPDAGANVGLAGATARGCLVLGPSRVQLEACAGVAAGAAFASAFGIQRSDPGRALWVGFEGGPRVVWRPRPRLGLRLGIVGVAGARHPAFAIADRPDPIHRIGVAAFRVSLGLETGWP